MGTRRPSKEWHVEEDISEELLLLLLSHFRTKADNFPKLKTHMNRDREIIPIKDN